MPYVPGTGELKDEQDRNGPCPPENNNLEDMRTQKWAITARGLFKVPSLIYSQIRNLGLANTNYCFTT